MARSKSKGLLSTIVCILLVTLLLGAFLNGVRTNKETFETTITSVYFGKDGYASVAVDLALNKSDLDENACLRVTYPDGTKENIALPQETNEKYTVHVPVPITYMSEKVSVELLPKGKLVKVYKNFTFSDELARVLSNPDEYTVSYVRYAEAMDTCIRAVMSVFYDTEAPKPTAEMDAIKAEDLKAYAQTVKGSTAGVKISPIKLTANFGANIDLYYESTEAEYCTINGKRTESVEIEDGEYRVSKTDISAFDYKKNYTFYVGETEVRCSVLSFVYATLSCVGLPEHWYTAAKSIYLLHEAAMGL